MQIKDKQIERLQLKLQKQQSMVAEVKQLKVGLCTARRSRQDSVAMLPSHSLEYMTAMMLIHQQSVPYFGRQYPLVNKPWPCRCALLINPESSMGRH